MRRLIAFLFGLLLGVGVVLAGIWYNPLGRDAIDVPINVTDNALILNYDSPISGSVFYVNSGLERLPRNPGSQDALYYPTQRGANVSVHVLKNRRGEPVGLGIKYFALNEASRVLPTSLVADSSWQVAIPGAGSFFIESQENYWPFVRAVLLPAALGDGRWEGRFSADSTVGPKGTFEANFYGGSGVLAGRRGVASESFELERFSLRTTGEPATPFGVLTVVPEPLTVAAPADDPVNPPSE